MGEENPKLGPGELYINGEPFAGVLEATTEEEIPETFAEDGEPLIPKTLLHEASFSCELSDETAKAFKRLAEASAVLAQAINDWVANLVQAIEPAVEYYADLVGEAVRELFENAPEKPPRVNKRPDYSQRPKACTRAKIKRIRTQRSREKK